MGVQGLTKQVELLDQARAGTAGVILAGQVPDEAIIEHVEKANGLLIVLVVAAIDIASSALSLGFVVGDLGDLGLVGSLVGHGKSGDGKAKDSSNSELHGDGLR